MCVVLDGFEGGFRIGGRMVTNLRYADDIVLIASSEDELQDLVSQVSCQSGASSCSCAGYEGEPETCLLHFCRYSLHLP